MHAELTKTNEEKEKLAKDNAALKAELTATNLSFILVPDVIDLSNEDPKPAAKKPVTAPTAGNTPAVRNKHSHLNTAWTIEWFGGQRVLVTTPDLPKLWPELTVTEQTLIPRSVYLENASLHQTHVCVMLPGLTDQRRYSERNYPVYVPLHTIEPFTHHVCARLNCHGMASHHWVHGFTERLLLFAKEKRDLGIWAYGIDAARRFFEPLRQSRFWKPEQDVQANILAVEKNINQQVWNTLGTVAGPDFTREV